MILFFLLVYVVFQVVVSDRMVSQAIGQDEQETRDHFSDLLEMELDHFYI